MDREVRAGIGLVVCLVVLVLIFIGLIRYIVPMILEAHFAGSMLVASLVAIAGVVGIVVLALIMFKAFMRAIRNDVRSYIAEQAEKVPVSCDLNQPTTTVEGQPGTTPASAQNCPGSLMGPGRQAVIRAALAQLSRKWAAEGVVISDLRWVGSLRYPPTITNAITERQATEQRTRIALQKEAEARANAQAAIETARGVAESTRLRGEALRANPEIIQQIYAERSRGYCPPGTQTCIIGQNGLALESQR